VQTGHPFVQIFSSKLSQQLPEVCAQDSESPFTKNLWVKIGGKDTEFNLFSEISHWKVVVQKLYN
jgi:hypothetical protein